MFLYLSHSLSPMSTLALPFIYFLGCENDGIGEAEDCQKQNMAVRKLKGLVPSNSSTFTICHNTWSRALDADVRARFIRELCHISCISPPVSLRL